VNHFEPASVDAADAVSADPEFAGRWLDEVKGRRLNVALAGDGPTAATRAALKVLGRSEQVAIKRVEFRLSYLLGLSEEVGRDMRARRFPASLIAESSVCLQENVVELAVRRSAPVDAEATVTDRYGTPAVRITRQVVESRYT